MMEPAKHMTLNALLRTNAEEPADPVYRPQQFHLSTPDDRHAVQELLRDQPGIRVYDSLFTQLRDLIRARYPRRKFSAAELDSLVTEHLGDSPIEEYGTWFYYPWSMRLVHLLDESEFVELRTNRNRYKITPQEQAELACKRIGIVGLSVGQSVALTLTLERSFGELRLADFDRLDLSNLNRIRAGVHNLNIPKVSITAREIAEIDPYLKVTCFPNGITEMNCDAFLLEPSPLDVVVEECDSIDIKILLRHRARVHRIPVVMETCDRGMLDIERFDREPERPIFHGLVGDVVPESLRGLTREQKIPYILQIIGVDTLSERLRASLIEVEQSISTWPQLASAVAHGGAATADVVRRICIGDQLRSGRYYADLDALIPSGGDPNFASAADDAHAGTPPALELRDMLSAVACLQREPGGLALAPDMVRRLVTDATLAPSGGNCQPWKWLSDGDYLYLFHDLSRSRTPFDPDSFGGLVALGAAAENLVLSAHVAGLQVLFDLFPCKEIPGLVTRFRFSLDPGPRVASGWWHELHSMIGVRRTNRKLCPRRPLQRGDLDALTAAVRSIPGAGVRWLLRDDELDECGQLLGTGDRLLFLTESLNRFLVNEIRWTPTEAEATRDGISLESLHLSPQDRAGFQLCRHWPSLRLVRRLRGGHGLENTSRKALASASAFGLITMECKTSSAYFWGGRAMERLWLTAAKRQIALHPMTGLSYLLSASPARDGPGLDMDTEETLRELRPRYEKLFSVAGSCAHVFLFRLSYAEETAQRSLRHHVDDVLSIV